MSDTEGVWVAYYSDGSSFYVHPSEIAALRFALDRSCEVIFLPYAVSIHDAEKAERARRTREHTDSRIHDESRER